MKKQISKEMETLVNIILFEDASIALGCLNNKFPQLNGCSQCMSERKMTVTAEQVREFIHYPDTLTIQDLRAIALAVANAEVNNQVFYSFIAGNVSKNADVFLEVALLYSDLKRENREIVLKAIAIDNAPISAATSIFSLPYLPRGEMLTYKLQFLENQLKACSLNPIHDAQMYAFLIEFLWQDGMESLPPLLSAIAKLGKSVITNGNVLDKVMSTFSFNLLEDALITYCVQPHLSEIKIQKYSSKAEKLRSLILSQFCLTNYNWSDDEKSIIKEIFSESKNINITEHIFYLNNYKWFYEEYGFREKATLVYLKNKERNTKLSILSNHDLGKAILFFIDNYKMEKEELFDVLYTNIKKIVVLLKLEKEEFLPIYKLMKEFRLLEETLPIDFIFYEIFNHKELNVADDVTFAITLSQMFSGCHPYLNILLSDTIKISESLDEISQKKLLVVVTNFLFFNNAYQLKDCITINEQIFNKLNKETKALIDGYTYILDGLEEINASLELTAKYSMEELKNIISRQVSAVPDLLHGKVALQQFFLNGLINDDVINNYRDYELRNVNDTYLQVEADWLPNTFELFDIVEREIYYSGASTVLCSVIQHGGIFVEHLVKFYKEACEEVEEDFNENLNNLFDLICQDWYLNSDDLSIKELYEIQKNVFNPSILIEGASGFNTSNNTICNPTVINALLHFGVEFKIQDEEIDFNTNQALQGIGLNYYHWLENLDREHLYFGIYCMLNKQDNVIHLIESNIEEFIKFKADNILFVEDFYTKYLKLDEVQSLKPFENCYNYIETIYDWTAVEEALILSISLQKIYFTLGHKFLEAYKKYEKNIVDVDMFLKNFSQERLNELVGKGLSLGNIFTLFSYDFDWDEQAMQLSEYIIGNNIIGNLETGCIRTILLDYNVQKVFATATEKGLIRNHWYRIAKMCQEDIFESIYRFISYNTNDSDKFRLYNVLINEACGMLKDKTLQEFKLHDLDERQQQVWVKYYNPNVIQAAKESNNVASFLMHLDTNKIYVGEDSLWLLTSNDTVCLLQFGNGLFSKKIAADLNLSLYRYDAMEKQHLFQLMHSLSSFQKLPFDVNTKHYARENVSIPCYKVL